MSRNVVIRCAWDDEANVWYVHEADIPGLVTEAPSVQALRRKLPEMIGDLLDVDVALEIEIVPVA